MNLQRQCETGCLIPVLALYPLDSADMADDGLDTLPERREVHTLRQAIQRGVEVEFGVPLRHLGEDLGHGTLAKPPGLIGQRGRPIGVELLQGPEDALEEDGQLGIGPRVALRGIPHIWHPHGS